MQGKSIKHVLTILGLLALAACASTGGNRDRHAGHYPTPNPHVKVGNPYVVLGKTYYPKAVPVGTVVEGTASWYGPNFHGKLTANGELFDMNRLSAAHKTLPLPSLVRVTNMENGKTAVLRLNDRGPYAHERVIDLSRAAAEKLDMRDKGLASVRVEYLGPADIRDAIVKVGEPENYAALTPPPALTVEPAPIQPLVVAEAAPIEVSLPAEAEPIEIVYETVEPDLPQPIERSKAYFVQIGAFSSPDNVNAARAMLPEVIPVNVKTTENQLHLVRLGPYDHEFAAEEAQKVAQKHGFEGARIVQDDQAN